jgi:hypothetical protein
MFKSLVWPSISKMCRAPIFLVPASASLFLTTRIMCIYLRCSSLPCTLPDVFIKNNEKMIKFLELCSENVYTDTWIMNLKNENLQESVITARCTTKRFACGEKRLVDYAATNFDNPLLQKILPTIYKNTAIPTFIDKR